MNSSVLSLADYAVGDAVKLDDGSTASAYSDTKALHRVAIGLKFHDSATGVLKVVSGNGNSRTIDSAGYAKGVWHPVQIKQIKSTNTTTTNTHIELGWSKH